MFFCLYCGRERPDESRSTEHPLPQAIGGTGWSTQDVCQACNTYCGREIDSPYANHLLVRAARHRLRVPDARGVVPPAPRAYGRTKRTGRRAEVAFEGDGLKTRRIPEPTSADATHEEYVVDYGDGERILALRTERLKRQMGPDYEIRGTVAPITLPPEEAQIEVSIPLDLWPRLGAKLGLGFGGLAMGEDWAQSTWAGWLRACLRGDAAEAPDPRVVLQPLPFSLENDDTLSLLTDQPNHTIFLVGSEPAALMVHLFGLWCYLVPLGPSANTGGPAWKFDSVRGRAEQTTFDALVLDAITRLDGRNAETPRSNPTS